MEKVNKCFGFADVTNLGISAGEVDDVSAELVQKFSQAIEKFSLQ